MSEIDPQDPTPAADPLPPVVVAPPLTVAPAPAPQPGLDALAKIERIQEDGKRVPIYLPGTSKLIGEVLAPFAGTGRYAKARNRLIDRWKRAKNKNKAYDMDADRSKEVIAAVEKIDEEAGLGTIATDFFLFTETTGGPRIPNRLSKDGEPFYSDDPPADGATVHMENLRTKIWCHRTVQNQVSKFVMQDDNYTAEADEELAGN